jgi:hypothetical protein
VQTPLKNNDGKTEKYADTRVQFGRQPEGLNEVTSDCNKKDKEDPNQNNVHGWTSPKRIRSTH